MAQHSNWICPQCGLSNISGDTYKCPRCGKKRNRWGYWACASCSTKTIRADHKECPNCGRPRARNVKFYLPADRWEFVDEVSGQEAVRIGRQNWICPYCNQQNDDSTDTCVYCNAARSESRERYFDVPAPQPVQNTGAAAGVKKQKSMPAISCTTVILLLIVGFMGWVLFGNLIRSYSSKKVRTASDYRLTWQYDIDIEELRTFKGADWELPANARLVEKRIVDYVYVDHYERRSREVWVDDPVYNDDDYGGGWDDGGWDGGGGYDGGWADYGDGQFGVFQIPQMILGAAKLPELITMHYETEWYDEPIYASVPRDKYYYEYDEWVYSRSITTRGTNGETPYFDESTPLAEKEREKGRRSQYFVFFEDGSRSVRCPLSEDLYQQLNTLDTFEYRRDTTAGSSNPFYYIVIDGREYAADPNASIETPVLSTVPVTPEDFPEQYTMTAEPAVGDAAVTPNA